jgi:hypothetical protein
VTTATVIARVAPAPSTVIASFGPGSTIIDGHQTTVVVATSATGPAGSGGVATVVAGTDIAVDATDPTNPIVGLNPGFVAAFGTVAGTVQAFIQPGGQDIHDVDFTFPAPTYPNHLVFDAIYITLTASRVVTLPDTSAGPGVLEIQRYRVIDTSGNCAGGKTITVVTSGADVILNGTPPGTATSLVLNSAYAQVQLWSPNQSQWVIV